MILGKDIRSYTFSLFRFQICLLHVTLGVSEFSAISSRKD